LLAVPDSERSDLNDFFRHRLPHMSGLGLAPVAVLAGIADMGTETTRYIHVAALVEMRRLERIRGANFTKGKGRRKYARACHVADIFVQFYLKVLKERPTYGTSDGHPSTRFATALQEIFQVLGIDADVRGPAKSAIKRITDEDINRTHGPFKALAAYGVFPVK
jgi:hypothetical protein